MRRTSRLLTVGVIVAAAMLAMRKRESLTLRTSRSQRNSDVLKLGANIGANYAGIGYPADDAHGDIEIGEPRAQDRHDGDDQDQKWKGHEQVRCLSESPKQLADEHSLSQARAFQGGW